jgi:hypothetical protein
MKSKEKRADERVCVEELPSDMVPSIPKTAVKELMTRPTTSAPVDVLHIRDVPSFLDEGQYFMGMYSVGWNPDIKCTTPEQVLSLQDSSKITGFKSIAEEETGEEKYCNYKTLKKPTVKGHFLNHW